MYYSEKKLLQLLTQFLQSTYKHKKKQIKIS